jgi:hypothetical protein
MLINNWTCRMTNSKVKNKLMFDPSQVFLVIIDIKLELMQSIYLKIKWIIVNPKFKADLIFC